MRAHIEIQLTGGEIALVDVDDWPAVRVYNWCANRDRRWGITYVTANTLRPDGGRTTIKLHRLITGVGAGQQVDHRNHNGLDNRRANLRIATPSQNAANNRPTRGRSGYKGVSWDKQLSKWRASITVDRRSRHLGLFMDPWEAAQAYNAAALAAWGPFAYVNPRIVTELLGGSSVTHLQRKKAS